MSILLVLVTFLLFVTVSYLRTSRRQPEKELPLEFGVPLPRMVHDAGLEIPEGYAFHPGHTWVHVQDRQHARIGLDSFAANLLGRIDRVEAPGPNRWIRQGQKVVKLSGPGFLVELAAPVEGVVTGVNEKVLADPGVLARDPYGEGWILMVQSPDLLMNLKNLLRGGVVRPWMRSALDQLATMTAGPEASGPAFAQDGGLPIFGLLATLEPELQRDMIREFFLE